VTYRDLAGGTAEAHGPSLVCGAVANETVFWRSARPAPLYELPAA
jgi:hypothetical protein